MGGQVEGLVLEVVPVEEEEEDQRERPREEGRVGALAGQEDAGWSEGEHGWEAACKAEA